MITQIRKLLCDKAGIRYPDKQLQNYIDQGKALCTYIPIDKLPEKTDINTLEEMVIQQWVSYQITIINHNLEKAMIHLNALQMLFKKEIIDYNTSFDHLCV